MTTTPKRPRNQLGEVATKTPAEAVARLSRKVAKNHGGANRERIRARISAAVAQGVAAGDS